MLLPACPRLRRTFTAVGLAGAIGCSWVTAARAEPACNAASLRTEADRAWAWRRNWTLINVALTVGSFAAVPLVQREDRPDWIISGAGSGITALTTFVFPLRVESAADELDALPLTQRARAWPHLWRESAEDEQDRVTWPWHLANIALSAGVGSVIAFGYHHYASGAITAAIGATLGEVQIFTQPTRLTLDGPDARAWLPSFSYAPRSAGAPARFFLTLSGAL
ncbi:MAG TPA: hypothetical protein VHB79_17565 [Polyangiaceae bacterium]|nr:hypothetical protein [Polyangiaceae bacterium]